MTVITPFLGSHYLALLEIDQFWLAIRLPNYWWYILLPIRNEEQPRFQDPTSSVSFPYNNEPSHFYRFHPVTIQNLSDFAHSF